MKLRKRFLFAMLVAIAAVVASATVSVGAPFRSKGEPLPGLLVPAQFKNTRDLGVGKLLVASRSLADPMFAGTVILLIHYDEKGAVGLVLNRRTKVPLSRVLDLKSAKDRSDPVYLGGPVEPSAIFALLQSPAEIKKAENIFPGVYFITDKRLFEKTMSGRPDPGVFHVYLGYAGWTQEQLRAEVQSGAWFVFSADTGTVFNSDPDALWLKMIQKTELHWAKTTTGQDMGPISWLRTVSSHRIYAARRYNTNEPAASANHASGKGKFAYQRARTTVTIAPTK